MSIYIYGFLISLVFALCLTPLVIRLAIRLGVVDKPNKRKVHQRTMPRMGGLAIYASVLLGYLAISYFNNSTIPTLIIGVLCASTIIVITGVIDDKIEIRPITKLMGQILAAGVLIGFGVEIQTLHIPFMDQPVQLGWLGIPLTILWLVGITNAVNLIDGLDGLAAGVSGIAAIAFFFVSLTLGNAEVAMFAIVLVGAIFGFLRYNFHPAKIFMGDTGSLFLGFTLASLSLLELKQVTVLSVLVPVMILAIPISDTLYAIIRRKMNGQPISQADKKHLHHCLLELGFSHRQTVLIIYGISSILAIIAVLMANLALWVSVIVMLLYAFVLQWFMELIGMFGKNKRPIMDGLFGMDKKEKN